MQGSREVLIVTISSGFFRQGEDLSNLSNLDLRKYFLRIFKETYHLAVTNELKKFVKLAKVFFVLPGIHNDTLKQKKKNDDMKCLFTSNKCIRVLRNNSVLIFLDALFTVMININAYNCTNATMLVCGKLQS